MVDVRIQRARDLGLDHTRAHLLFVRYRHGAALFRLRLRDLLIRVRLVNLQFGADVLADVQVRDVDRENLVVPL
jgi:hypothetical protein